MGYAFDEILSQLSQKMPFDNPDIATFLLACPCLRVCKFSCFGSSDKLAYPPTVSFRDIQQLVGSFRRFLIIMFIMRKVYHTKSHLSSPKVNNCVRL